MSAFFEAVGNVAFAAQILRVATPILLAALGATIASQAGCLNMGLEGIMLFAALTGVYVSSMTQNASWGAWAGLLAALAVGALLGALLAYLVLHLKTDATLAGVAINVIGSNATVFLMYVWTGSPGTSASQKSYVLPTVSIPVIRDIPVVGTVFSGQNVVTYMAFALVAALAFFLYRTPLGLRIRGVGLNPGAADSVGINVVGVKYLAYVLSGVLAAMGGAFMSMGYVSWFARDMTAGRGFIALAAQAMGRSTPVGSMLSSIFFGFTMALSNSMQSLSIPFELIEAMPYACTILALSAYAYQQTRKKKQSSGG
ncbi:MAG: ABC transporter permease [Clostridiales bacterium]|nr:ABC transporter permease [Clostridiales bacterium]